ncbi:MAG: YraN family protein [Lachnospiraceae bacterium]|nr:YraN family protein [Lachnospiraceae bacterium]
MSSRDVGNQYEEMVATFLKDRGMEIVERNYSCFNGEVDIIAHDKDYLVFVEVKYRASDEYGSAAEAVDKKKQKKISKVAKHYLKANGISEFAPVRFDVAAVSGDTIEYYENAFDYAGR